MTKAADPNLLDNLWYFDSVVSSRPPIKRGKSKSKLHAAAAAAAKVGAAENNLNESRESQLPLSTGGDDGGAITYASVGSSYGGRAEEGGESGCGSCMKRSSSSPSMCELVAKMEEGAGELSAKELGLWMQKLGLEYTGDGAMIRRVQPNSQLSSQQKLDFSEFVCLNRFIEDERHEIADRGHMLADSSSFSDAHMAALHDIFRLFDRDDNGLISPSELRAALAKLGLTNANFG